MLLGAPVFILTLAHSIWDILHGDWARRSHGGDTSWAAASIKSHGVQ